MFKTVTLLGASLWLGMANAHLAAWHKGMYCLNGNTAGTDLNSYSIVTPLYQLSFNDWWFHHVNGCDNFPPAEGDYVDLPAGGQFTIEIGSNRAKTSLSYGGRDMSDWPDGSTYPEDYNIPGCISSPNMHTQNRSMAAGTAFAISYQSDIKKVTPDNLVVFTVRYNTPWKRVVVYDVPAAMPSCPPGGCICAWGWVPNGCGQPNMYHQAFKCRVSRSTSNTAVAAPKPPVWCEGNPGGCTKGAKQMIYWNQNERNNIHVSGYDHSGSFKSPAYNNKLGFPDGAQNDIFAGPPSSGGSSNSGNSGSGSDSNAGNSGSESGSSGSSSDSSAGSGSPPPSSPSASPSPSSPSANLPPSSPTISPSPSSPSISPSPSSPSISPSPSSPSVNPPPSSPSFSPSPSSSGDNDGTIISISVSLPGGTPNPAPSCKKTRRRRRRSIAAARNSQDASLVRKSGVASHRRNVRRAGGRDPEW